jgi:hypothetical protein
MSATVFFSWQSDRPTTEGRNFIERALDVAVKNISQDIELQPALRDGLEVDKDTKNVPGSPKIFETILEKIELASVFVPDFTFVAVRPKGEPTPNPNVLIEYGYALKCKSNRQFMPVMNIAYGEPRRETMPFDLIEHRNPITYNLPTDADEDTRKAERSKLAKAFESGLRSFFESDDYKKLLPKPEPVTYREPKDGRARFRASGEPIGLTRPVMAGYTGEKAAPVYLSGGAAMWLRVGPQIPLKPPWKLTDIESRAAALAVLPLCELAGSVGLVRSGDGCGYYPLLGKESSPSGVFIFSDGEIWAISTFFLAFKPEWILLEEARFTSSLEQCADFLNRLAIPGPYHWVAGTEGILNRY